MTRKRKLSIHDLKRRLIHRLAQMGTYDAERIVVTIREAMAAQSFKAGYSIERLTQDIDHGGGPTRIAVRVTGAGTRPAGETR